MRRLPRFLFALMLCLACCGARAEDRFFDSNGARIHYIVEGEGEPLVLIHGFTGSVESWRSLLPALRGFRVVALDCRGHGKSDKPHDAKRYGREMIADVVRLMDHLNIRRAHVAGYSMGAIITAKLLEQHPDRLRTAMLGGAAGIRENDPMLRMAAETANALKRGEGITPILRALIPEGERQPSAAELAAVNQFLLANQDTQALAAVMRSFPALVVSEAKLKSLRVPVTAIIGSKDPLISMARVWKERLPDLPIVEIAGGDHGTTPQMPEFAQAFRKFLDANREEKRVAQSVLTSEFLYEMAPFPSCHASTLAEASGGKLVAAWFGGTDEGEPDVGIWLSRHDGKGWSPPVEVADGAQAGGTRFPCWNPVLFQPKKGPLLLFYKVGPNPRQWWGMLKTSRDGGKTWSAAQRLPDGILGPIKNKPVALPDGSLLCGSSTEHDGWRVHLERTPDLGKTWETVGPLNDGKEVGAIQPSILLHPGGKMQLLCRGTKGSLLTFWSEDGGKTWGPLANAALPNPNAGTDAVMLQDGRALLVFNNTQRGRTPLSVAVSRDGKAWKVALNLEEAPGEYSYPAVIQAADGKIHITYTWKRQRIRHIVLDPALLPDS